METLACNSALAFTTNRVHRLLLMQPIHYLHPQFLVEPGAPGYDPIGMHHYDIKKNLEE